jgi:hypothetical protein
MMDELETMKIVAAAWQQQTHQMLDQIVAMNIQAALAARDAETGERDGEEFPDGP